MRGICIDDTNSQNLKKGNIYFLFSCDNNSYYVSNFERVSSHFGAFSKGRFEILNDKLLPPFKEGTFLKAYLYNSEFGHPNGSYYLEVIGKNGDYAYYYDDPRLKVAMRGRHLRDFKDFEIHNPELLPKEKVNPEVGKCYKAYFWKEGKQLSVGEYFIKIVNYGWSAEVYSDSDMQIYLGLHKVGYFERFEEYELNNIDISKHSEISTEKHVQLSIFDLLEQENFK